MSGFPTRTANFGLPAELPQLAAWAPAQSPTDQRWTTQGKMAFVLALSLTLSAFPNLRPQAFGLSVHPYLVVMALCLPFALAQRTQGRPTAVHRAGVLLFVGLMLSTFAGSGVSTASLGTLIKWATLAATFFVVERLILTRKDFELATWGLVAAVGLIALRGLYLFRLRPTFFIEPMPGVGSRNVFSLWTIAPLALGLLLLTSRHGSRWQRWTMAGLLLAMTIPQFLSLSRSGWLLLAGIFLMVFSSRINFKLVVFGLLAIFLVQLVVERLGFEGRVEGRYTELLVGTGSDSKRRELITHGLETFLQHPLLGVSQEELPKVLGKRVGSHRGLSSHNLYVEMLAGTGLVGTIPLLLVIGILVRTWHTCRQRGYFADRPELIRGLPIILIATGFRALTSDEILFCPAIIFGIACCYGLFTSRELPLHQPPAAELQPHGPSA